MRKGQTSRRAGGSRAGERAGRGGAVHDEQVASKTQVGVREKDNCNDAVPPLASTTTVLIVQDEARVRVWVRVCGWRWLCHRKTTPVGKKSVCTLTTHRECARARGMGMDLTTIDKRAVCSGDGGGSDVTDSRGITSTRAHNSSPEGAGGCAGWCAPLQQAVEQSPCCRSSEWCYSGGSKRGR